VEALSEARNWLRKMAQPEARNGLAVLKLKGTRCASSPRNVALPVAENGLAAEHGPARGPERTGCIETAEEHDVQVHLGTWPCQWPRTGWQQNMAQPEA